jgi:hypothetical protein
MHFSPNYRVHLTLKMVVKIITFVRETVNELHALFTTGWMLKPSANMFQKLRPVYPMRECGKT